jgi:transcriptional regulator GlxA family with amidase domain
MSNQGSTVSKRHISRRAFLQSSAGAALACSCMDASLRSSAVNAAPSHNPAATPRAYVCPPCGLPCDKLTFEKPGNCPACGMTLIPSSGAEDGPPRVSVLLFGGAQLIDFAGPWEVFGTAGLLVHSVAEKPEVVTVVFGPKITPDYTFDNSPKADVLLVPGGGIWQEAINNERLIRWIQQQAKDAKHVLSVCTGAFLLQKAGLLAGQTATSTYGMIDDLTATDTKIVFDKRFVDSGKIVTTAGLSAGIDGALHVVSRLLGNGVAQSVALQMEYNWNPAGTWARAALADRFLPDGLAYAKPNIKGAEAKMVSTAGDADHWETRILVSRPGKLTEVIALMEDRLTANHGTSGMFKPVSHIRGTTRVVAVGESELKWSFTDDRGRHWTGLCIVEPAPAGESFPVTFKLAREPAGQKL